MDKLLERQTQLTQLMNGTITGTSIVGRGYKSPKGVASQWLRKEIHNIEYPNAKISDLYVQKNGKPYPTELKAKQSAAYRQLVEGTFELITDGLMVSEYGVMPVPGDDEGYCVFIVTTRQAIFFA